MPAENYTDAEFLLTDTVYALLCGLPQHAKDLAVFAERGLAKYDPSAEDDEREPRLYYRYAGEALRQRSLALVRWILHRGEDLSSFHSAVDHWDWAFVEGRSLSPRADSVELDSCIADCVQAGEYLRGIHLYEREDRHADEPINLSGVLSLRRLCYVICRHFERRELALSDLLKSFDVFLKRNMLEWLSNGMATHVAIALKIRFGNVVRTSASPREIILRAYDYLPAPTAADPRCDTSDSG